MRVLHRAATLTLTLCLTSACSASNPPQASGSPVPRIQSGASGAALAIAVPGLEGGAFARDITCDGADRTPDITTGAVPPSTRSIAIELIDPDAPGGTFMHWSYFRDGGPVNGRLSQPVTRGGVTGINSFGKVSFNGPCPPAGQTHHYHLIVLALDAPLGTAPGGAGLRTSFTSSEFEAVWQQRGLQRSPQLVHITDRADLYAKYRR